MLGHNNGPELAYARPAGDGFVAIARSVRVHEVVGFGMAVKPAESGRGAYSRFEAFCDLIMECRYKAGKVLNGGKVMLLQPGQLVGAVSWLASRWNWTPKTVRGFLDKLESEGMIERSSGLADGQSKTVTQKGRQNGKQASVITVSNYTTFQSVPDVKGQTQGQAEGQTKGNKLTKEQENPNIGIYTTPRARVREEPALPKGDFWADAMRPKGEPPEARLSEMGVIELRADVRRAMAAEAEISDAQVKAACRRASGNVNGRSDALTLKRLVQQQIGYMQSDQLRAAARNGGAKPAKSDELSADYKRELEMARQQDEEWGVICAKRH